MMVYAPMRREWWDRVGLGSEPVNVGHRLVGPGLLCLRRGDRTAAPHSDRRSAALWCDVTAAPQGDLGGGETRVHGTTHWNEFVNRME